jgi:hypothetical protein
MGRSLRYPMLMGGSSGPGRPMLGLSGAEHPRRASLLRTQEETKHEQNDRPHLRLCRDFRCRRKCARRARPCIEDEPERHYRSGERCYSRDRHLAVQGLGASPGKEPPAEAALIFKERQLRRVRQGDTKRYECNSSSLSYSTADFTRASRSSLSSRNRCDK